MSSFYQQAQRFLGEEDDGERVLRQIKAEEEEETSPEEGFQAELRELLLDAGYRSSTYQEAGIMTNNKGLLVRGPEGEFQLTIVHRRRR